MGHTLKANLTSYIKGADTPDAGLVEVEMDDVPIIGVETQPLAGLTTYYGIAGAPAALEEEIRIAEAAGEQLYEVRLHIAYEVGRMNNAPRIDDIRRSTLINLPRATVEASEWLADLVRDEVEALDDAEITDSRLPKIISKYPHLIDRLIARPELQHVAVVLWQADVPGLRAAKLATLYRPDCVREIETVNSDWLKAVLPKRLYQTPGERAGLLVTRKHTTRRSPGR